jgi:catecholate siderophore receptor
MLKNTLAPIASHGPPFEVMPLVIAAGLSLMGVRAAAQPATLPTVQVEAAADNAFKPETASQGKFTAPLIDTPRTVNVIPQEVLQQTRATTLTEALRLSPGITFGSGEGGNPMGDRPFIRGSDAQGSVFVDGARDIAAGSREMFNVESVEVIKGADSAYGGRGGAGGSINLTTKTARQEDFFAGDLSLGNASHKRGTIDLNRTVGESTAFRLNAMAHDADVPGRDGPTGRRWGVAPTVTFGLDTPDQLTLSYQHLSADEMPDGGIPYFYDSVAVPAMTRDVTLRPTDGGNRKNWYGLKARDKRTEDSDQVSANSIHKFSDTSQLRNLLRWSGSTQDYVWTQPDDSQGNTANGKVWRRFNSRYSKTHTLQNATEFTGKADTGGVGHSFAIGLELARERSRLDTYNMVDAAGNPIANTNQCATGLSPFMCTSLFAPNGGDPWTGAMVRNNAWTRYTTDTASVYAFDTVTLAPQWIVNGGLRFDHYKSGVTNPAGLEFNRTDSIVNYQIGVVYKVRPNGSLYVSTGSSSTPANAALGQGLESQGLDPTTGRVPVGNADELKPEKTRSIELGTKWDLMDARLGLTAAIFRNDTTNARVIDPSGTTASMVGKKAVNGLELGLTGRVSRDLDVFAGYTFMDSEQKNIGTVTSGALAGRPAAGTGLAFPNTPRHSFSLWANYRPAPRLTLGLGAFGQSEAVGGYGYTADGHLVTRAIAGYARLDAMLGYSFTPNLTLQVNIQNLTDKAYFASTYSTHYATPAYGRSVIATLQARF